MLRRQFLKYLSSLPFVGSLFAVGDSDAPEGQREETQEEEDIVTRLRKALCELEIDSDRPDYIVVSPESEKYIKEHLFSNVEFCGDFCRPFMFFRGILVKKQDIDIFDADAVIVGKPRFPEYGDTLPAYQKVLYHANKT